MSVIDVRKMDITIKCYDQNANIKNSKKGKDVLGGYGLCIPEIDEKEKRRLRGVDV